MKLKEVIRHARNVAEDKRFENRILGNKGSMTVEASVIFPVTILIIFFVLYAYIYILDREILRSGIYETIYTAPLVDADKYLESNMDAGEVGGTLIWCGEEDVVIDSRCGSGIVSVNAVMDMKGETDIEGKTEYDVCTDRLRRWQLYGDITEE